MKLSDFDFELPERLIATRPAVPRTSAKMLVAQGDHITDTTVANMSDWLRPGASPPGQRAGSGTGAYRSNLAGATGRCGLDSADQAVEKAQD